MATGPEEVKEYIWDGDGDYTRAEGAEVVHYVKGDVVKMTAKQAYYAAGYLKTRGGLIVPKKLFDGKHHPYVSDPKPSSPQERKAAEDGPGVEGKADAKVDAKVDAKADAKSGLRAGGA